MTPERAREIRAVWDAIEHGEPDISTERLMQMTADYFGFRDVSPVTDALYLLYKLEQKEKGKDERK